MAYLSFDQVPLPRIYLSSCPFGLLVIRPSASSQDIPVTRPVRLTCHSTKCLITFAPPHTCIHAIAFIAYHQYPALQALHGPSGLPTQGCSFNEPPWLDNRMTPSITTLGVRRHPLSNTPGGQQVCDVVMHFKRASTSGRARLLRARLGLEEVNSTWACEVTACAFTARALPARAFTAGAITARALPARASTARASTARAPRARVARARIHCARVNRENFMASYFRFLPVKVLVVLRKKNCRRLA